MFIANEHSDRCNGRPHCERHDGRTHSCSVGDYGHVGPEWMAPPSPVGADGWPHRGLPIPLNPLSYLHQSTSFASVLSAAPSFLSVLVGGGWCLNHCPPSHIRLRSYFHLCRRHVHHVHHQILRRYESPSSNNCPCPSVPCGMPVLRRHQIFSCSCSWPHLTP